MVFEKTSRPRSSRMARLAVLRDPLVWFLISFIAVFATRAVTTLAQDPQWATPGTGWRSVWQITMAAICIVGLASPRLRGIAVLIVSSIYLCASVIELFSPDVLLGVIPVDMRDRIVHPLVGLVGALVLASTARRRVADRGDGHHR